jgi:hypothetical protein
MDLFSGLSDVYSETFPSSGSMRNGSVYVRPTPAHLTDGSACSSSPGLLPTPSVADGTGGHLTRSGSRSDELLLPGVAKSLAEGPLLPTPTVSDTNGAGAHGTGGPDLRTAVSLLPTPRATDGTKGGPNQRGSSGDLMLPSAVMLLPTPTAMDSKASGGSTPSDVTLTDAVVRTEMGTQPNPRLMPTPRVSADRTSRSAATRRDSMSAPSLGQAVEIAQGILPREFISWEELPPSWHGDRTATPSNDGKPS